MTTDQLTSRTLCAVVLAVPSFGAPIPQLQRLEVAGVVLEDMLQSPDKGIPQDLLSKAQCAVIVPGLKKGAFFVGGTYGKGFMTCRVADGPDWSAPAAIRMEGGGIGLQFGGSETDLLLLVMNQRGAERLMSSQFTFGGEGMVSAGPVGREISAQTDVKFSNDLFSWSKSRGIFAGLSVNGATLRQDRDDNEALYGKRYSTMEVIHSSLPAPAEGSKLFDLLRSETRRQVRK
jgi:lipid-binding SYLF domain-containing protein